MSFRGRNVLEVEKKIKKEERTERNTSEIVVREGGQACGTCVVLDMATLRHEVRWEYEIERQ